MAKEREPLVEVIEEKEYVVVTAEMPGVPKEAIKRGPRRPSGSGCSTLTAFRSKLNGNKFLILAKLIYGEDLTKRRK
jgi:hypothetical protein